MGFLDSMVKNVASSVAYSASSEIGRAAGRAVGSVVTQATEGITDDMKAKNELKRKEENLPSKCPHCGAPTNKKIVCEYCSCKIVE